MVLNCARRLHHWFMTHRGLYVARRLFTTGSKHGNLAPRCFEASPWCVLYPHSASL